MSMDSAPLRVGDKVWKRNAAGMAFPTQGEITALFGDVATVDWYFPLGMGQAQISTETVRLAYLQRNQPTPPSDAPASDAPVGKQKPAQ